MHSQVENHGGKCDIRLSKNLLQRISVQSYSVCYTFCYTYEDNRHLYKLVCTMVLALCV